MPTHQALEFPHDGYIPPYVDSMLEQMIEKGGGTVSDSLRLTKVLVSQTGVDDCRASRVLLHLWQARALALLLTAVRWPRGALVTLHPSQAPLYPMCLVAGKCSLLSAL